MIRQKFRIDTDSIHYQIQNLHDHFILAELLNATLIKANLDYFILVEPENSNF